MGTERQERELSDVVAPHLTGDTPDGTAEVSKESRVSGGAHRPKTASVPTRGPRPPAPDPFIPDPHRIRLKLEAREDAWLSPFAAKSGRSRGRPRPEPPSPMRTEFQRDRDRIIHSKAFRRLKHKTQVFLAPLGDHYITRLTHTIQVSQIARTIARALDLNEDLTEAIALAHDIGHPPFGHAGEAVLAEMHPAGFRHNVQSLRVVDYLEKDGEGLNLTHEVRSSIAQHSKERKDISLDPFGVSPTLEGQIIKFADSIAYINHDIGDAIRGRVLAEHDLPGGPIRVLGSTHAERINTMVADVIESSWAATGEGVDAAAIERQADRPKIQMSPDVLAAVNELREFMFYNVYTGSIAKVEEVRAQGMIRMLYEHFMAHPDDIPTKFFVHNEPIDRAVVDFIAGMTDRYAIWLFQRIFVPQTWSAGL